MNSLYLRIYITVVAVLLAFALVAGWVVKRNIEQERETFQSQVSERTAAWAALIENSLPPADAPEAEQRAAVLEWSQRLRMALALDNEQGKRIATSELFSRREAELGGMPRRAQRIALSDGRALWIWRGGPRIMREAGPQPQPPGGRPPFDGDRPPEPQRDAGGSGFPLPPILFGGGAGLVVTLIVLFVAVAAGAYPVVRRLTRRLEALKRGVQTFGAGQLSHRVPVDGRDEVAEVAASFNDAAERVEQLVRANRSLLANASHELRSPLARLKMAVGMMDGAPPERRDKLRQEIDRDIRELDVLIDEVLLASRLDARTGVEREPVDLLGLAAEEAARVDAVLDGEAVLVQGEERLLRRALRNLLENARRYGGSEAPEITVRRAGAGQVELRVSDRGPGVPADQRERIFEPFYRLPGHAEHAGGVGLGLSLVRQIADRHGGHVRCEARQPAPGSCFVLSLPAAAA
ncbi:sensor histidine kinase [Methylibium rhizosphaerae]|jgi:signal transduction histidine kinase|uniref:sensor histidine kinase n=1 Tax=Methylibium rhizosphaerae TaxID=2570323 RepID=UPI0011299AA3|nr:HAMP domain-containing sensor histidine kinase [Methylibium rhizosphaerae]